MMSDGLRNRRNKSVDSHKDDFPHTYIVMQFVNNIHIEVVQWTLCKIQGQRNEGGAELLVRKQPSLTGEVYLNSSLN